MGSYPAVAEANFQDPTMCAIGCLHPHNQYVFYALEFGLIGLGLFLFMLYHAFKNWQPLKNLNPVPLVILSVFTLSGFFESTLWYRGFYYLFIPLLALSFMAPQANKKASLD
jgi:O-antigen ligase